MNQFPAKIKRKCGLFHSLEILVYFSTTRKINQVSEGNLTTIPPKNKMYIVKKKLSDEAPKTN